MKPRRTHAANQVFRLAGGNEDNDLWVELAVTDDDPPEPVIISTWEPSPEERQRIADGENVALIVWGAAQPPVLLVPTDAPLGRKPDA